MKNNPTVIRYRVEQPTWGRDAKHLRLYEDKWTVGPKVAMRHDTFGRSRYSITEFEKQAATPQGALNEHRAWSRGRVDDIQNRLDEAKRDLALAERTRVEIVNGRPTLVTDDAE